MEIINPQVLPSTAVYPHVSSGPMASRSPIAQAKIMFRR